MSCVRGEGFIVLHLSYFNRGLQDWYDEQDDLPLRFTFCQCRVIDGLHQHPTGTYVSQCAAANRPGFFQSLQSKRDENGFPAIHGWQ